jgi:hypothetical protein
LKVVSAVQWRHRNVPRIFIISDSSFCMVLLSLIHVRIVLHGVTVGSTTYVSILIFMDDAAMVATFVFLIF